MKEAQFIEIHQQEWADFKSYLDYFYANKTIKKNTKQNDLPTLVHEEFPAKYRRLCEQLSLAKTRQFSNTTINNLHELVMRAYGVLHQKKSSNWLYIYQLITVFPQAIRREKNVMIVAFLLFLIPALAGFLLVNYAPDLVYSFMSPDQVEGFEKMYYPTAKGLYRTSDNDVMMFGVYIYNNIGIGLRSFASGLILCVGAIFADVFNGLYLGLVAGHLHKIGYAQQTLYPYVITHGAFELTAIIISSGAGIRLGLCILFPKRLTRIASLKQTTRDLIPIVAGFVIMLVIAALFEAFFSASNLPVSVKYGVGTTCWILVYCYLFFVGRIRATK